MRGARLYKQRSTLFQGNGRGDCWRLLQLPSVVHTMDVNVDKLRENEFWRKKIYQAVKARDVDKNGYLSRADFELTLNRYKQLPSTTPQLLENLTKMMESFCNGLGLKDDSAHLNYAQAREIFCSMVKDWAEKGLGEQSAMSMFNCVDADGDGYISPDEWKNHYIALGIDPVHAPASFKAIDTSGDGRISREEFVAYHMEYYFTDQNKLQSSILYGPME